LSKIASVSGIFFGVLSFGLDEDDTLDQSIKGAEKITSVTVCEGQVDRGYRGHNYKGTAVIHIARSSNAGLSRSERKRKRRRSSIEPVIGHLKLDHRLDRCFLKGRVGDKLNLIGSAAGFNVRKLLRLLALGKFSRALLARSVFYRFWGSRACPSFAAPPIFCRP
jgi:hypothetical protein